MSYPVYIQQDYLVARPFPHFGPPLEALVQVQYQQYPPVYVTNQYAQPMPQPIPQQMAQRMPLLMDNSLSSQNQDLLFQPQNENLKIQSSFPGLLPQPSHLKQNLKSLLYSLSLLVPPMQSQQLMAPLNNGSYVQTQYPLSPASLHSDQKGSESGDSLKAPSVEIDYPSLVNYTVSPMAKRRRRTEYKNTNADPNASKHVCSTCGKSFQKPYNLKSHLKTHSSDRPFKCSVCPKTFARSHDRKRHEQLHEGVKNFKCEGFLKNGSTKWGCGKMFARSDALARHFRTETGWLCIKPLMDEAKELDHNGKLNAEHPSYFQHQIALPPLRQPF